MNELGVIGKECLTLMEEGSVVTLMEGAYINRAKLQKFKYHSFPIFTAQVWYMQQLQAISCISRSDSMKWLNTQRTQH